MNKGSLLIQAMLFGVLAAALIGGLSSWILSQLKMGRNSVNRETAFSMAEAGVEYYRWHLAHAPQDFRDGTGSAGSYVHAYTDKEGVSLGTFSLSITPPSPGSTLVTVRSTGRPSADAGVARTIEARLVIPSFAKYAVAANDVMRFGEGTEVFGPIHSNNGIRFDGLAHNLVTSAKETYQDPDHSGNAELGVHTHRISQDPFPPALPPDRPDVFQAGRMFPVPALDFAGVSANLSQMKTAAQAAGFYYPNSGALGYHVVLKTNDTFDLYRVNTLVPVPNGCTLVTSQQGWGTWSIASGGETFLNIYAFPPAGLLFFEDNVWVDGTINTARLTVASGYFPETPGHYTTIAVNKDLLYTNYDGRDSVGLVSQGNFTVGLVSEDDLRVDAALVAQNGRAGRYYYRPPTSQPRCSPYHTRQTITLYGTIVTNERYGFAYTDGTGYQMRNLIYDANLLYAPPPNFPLTSNQYSILSWREISP